MTRGVPQVSTLGSLLLLLHINYDDANILHTSDDINDIESVLNCEMTRVLN